MKIKINMRSAADIVKGQGVGSCYKEQVSLTEEGLVDDFEIYVNKLKFCDIYHYHTVNLEYYIERFFFKKNTMGVGYVHFLPDTLDDSLNLPKPFRKIFYKYILSFYNSMDYLVAVNPTVINKLLDYNVTKPRMFYIPNYVSEDSFFEKPEPERAKLREKYNIDKDKFVVLCAGQLQRRKGIFDFVKVAELLPEVQFVWAGGFSFGKITDGYDEIKEILENPPKNINFMGIVDRSEMNDIYNTADMFFLPSFDELFPMTILEAIAARVPIMLRDVELYEDILFDYYLKAKDAEGFAAVIKNMSKNPQLLKKQRDKSWECHKMYSKESILQMWKNIYSEAYEELTEKNKRKEKVLKI